MKKKKKTNIDIIYDILEIQGKRNRQQTSINKEVNEIIKYQDEIDGVQTDINDMLIDMVIDLQIRLNKLERKYGKEKTFKPRRFSESMYKQKEKVNKTQRKTS